jgi:hypothetical protein
MTVKPDHSKAEAQYGPGKEAAHCGGCAHFVPDEDPFAVGKCEKVAGGILWYRWCRLWQARA